MSPEYTKVGKVIGDRGHSWHLETGSDYELKLFENIRRESRESGGNGGQKKQLNSWRTFYSLLRSLGFLSCGAKGNK